MIRVKYANQAERTQVIIDNAGKYLTEEQDHKDGKFLIFDDVQKPESDKVKYKRLAIGNLMPDQIDNYIDTNVTDLSSVKTVLKVFGKALLLMSKKAL